MRLSLIPPAGTGQFCARPSSLFETARPNSRIGKRQGAGLAARPFGGHEAAHSGLQARSTMDSQATQEHLNAGVGGVCGMTVGRREWTEVHGYLRVSLPDMRVRRETARPKPARPQRKRLPEIRQSALVRSWNQALFSSCFAFRWLGCCTCSPGNSSLTAKPAMLLSSA